MTDSTEEHILGSKVASDQEKAWLRYYQKMKEEEPSRLEEAAKYLSALVSISLTMLMGFVRLQLVYFSVYALMMVSLLWIISILTGFAVLLPQLYKTNKESAQAIEQSVKRVVKTKGTFLGIAAVSFVLGLLLFVGTTFWVMVKI